VTATVKELVDPNKKEEYNVELVSVNTDSPLLIVIS